jgi:hypothetical protein
MIIGGVEMKKERNQAKEETNFLINFNLPFPNNRDYFHLIQFVPAVGVSSF